MSYIHSPQFNHYGTRLYSLFRKASSTGHYDSTWIQYFADEQKNHPFAMLFKKLRLDTMAHCSEKLDVQGSSMIEMSDLSSPTSSLHLMQHTRGVCADRVRPIAGDSDASALDGYTIFFWAA
uniref:Uncharacterized protein n=1 Tax=Caenorhabditis japonica TaxID=281687 RepID=A0A8R1EL24_CAEJA